MDTHHLKSSHHPDEDLDRNSTAQVKVGFDIVSNCIACGDYPERYLEKVHIPEVGPLNIRPITPQDAPYLERLFSSLSSRSIYFRYFTFIKQLTPAMLMRFTQIDYDMEIALVAMRESADDKDMLGVAQIIRLLDENKAEFSILVGDPWQGKGLGACLLQRCISIARQRCIPKIFGMVMAENTKMLELGRKLKFKRERLPESSDYLLTLTLKDVTFEGTA